MGNEASNMLFAYCACQQLSTQESPFFLLHGLDPRLPTPPILSRNMTRSERVWSEAPLQNVRGLGPGPAADHSCTEAAK